VTEFPRVGDRFGAYLITRQVGHGGMGVVFAAEQHPLNRTVALKVLDPKFSGDPSFAARFSREAEVLAQMDSPHIVQVFDHGTLDGCLYLAMQWVSGGDLAEYLHHTGPLPVALAADIGAQIASALADAHAHGIIHRDIKPSNILLARTGEDLFAYLCDFGIAQGQETGLTQAGTLAGSMAFTAPERHQGAPATERSDLYSLGCLLWVLVSGHNPYSGTDFQVAQQHFAAPIPQVWGTSPVELALNKTLSSLLAKDPAQRPGSAVEVVAQLRELARVAGSTPFAPPVPSDDRTRVRQTLPLTGSPLPPVPLPPTSIPSAPLPPIDSVLLAGTTIRRDTLHDPGMGSSANSMPSMPSTPPTQPRSQRQLAIVVGAAALALVLAIGVGWWALSRTPDKAGTTSRPGATTTVWTTPSGTSARPGSTASTQPAAAPQRDAAQRISATIPLSITNPHGVALDLSRQRVFVAGFGSASVEVISSATGTIETELPVGAKPESVVVDEGTGLLLVACEGSKRVELFTLDGLQQAASIPTASGALRLSVDSENHVAYVLAQGSSAIQRIDLSSRSDAGSIPGGNEPRDMAILPGNRTAYVAHWGAGQLTLIDLDGGSVSKTLPVGVNPNAVAISEQHRLALVANYVGASVTVVDLNAGAVIDTVGVGRKPSRIVIDDDAGVAYVSCLDSDEVSVVDLATLRVVRSLRTSSRPTGLALDSQTGTLYVTSFAGDVVQVFSA